MRFIRLAAAALTTTTTTTTLLQSTLFSRASAAAFVSFSPTVFHSTTSRTTTTTTTTTTFRKMSLTSSGDVVGVDDSAKQALLNCPTLELPNSEHKMVHPAIGFGTYKVGFIPASASSAVAASTGGGGGDAAAAKVERTAQECVADALRVGYRFLECAQFYGNEAQVGKAIAESGIPRQDLFLCSKVWTTTMEEGEDAIVAQFEKTLQDLGTDYLDLYLIHWPVPHCHIQAYKTLEKLYHQGKVRGIGLSNYSVEDYMELKTKGNITVKPLVNQIEINPFLYRKKTIEFFQSKEEGIVLQSYRSLRDGKAMTDPTLMEIAADNKKTVAQILGRWCVQHGFVYMPKSVQTERMVENAQVFDFSLTEEEMQRLDALTTKENLETFEALYQKCVNRDTSKDGTMEGVKMKITVD